MTARAAIFGNLVANCRTRADKIACCSLIAGTAQHRPDIGSNRENILRDFLSRHLPRRLAVDIGGQIVTHDGRESGQIDVIVSNDIGIRFNENEKTFFTAESVAGAITVKSDLDGNQLLDALANLARIPDPSEKFINFKLLGPGAVSAFLEAHPSHYVFAYDGMRAENCLAQVRKFYAEHPEIPTCRYPKGIIVNGRFMIRFFRADTQLSSYDLAKAGTFCCMELERDTRGYPFVQMLNDLASYMDWLNHMDVEIFPYFNAAFHSPICGSGRLDHVQVWPV